MIPDNYKCEGQMTLEEYLEAEPIYEVEVVGLLDDPRCPKCHRWFWTESKRNEVDIERCPDCGIRLDWIYYHKFE